MVDLAIAGRESYELVLTLTAFVTPDRVDSYEIGEDWFSATKASLGEVGTARIRSFAGCEHVVIRLLSVARDLPSPGGADGLVARLADMSADDVRLTLLGYFSRRTRRRVAADLIEAAARGDRDAQRRFATTAADGPECETALRSLLGRRSDDVKTELLELLATWRTHVFDGYIATVGPILEREVDRLRQRSASLSVDGFLEEVTRGATIVAEPGTDVIEVYPQWALRPWNVFWEHGTAQIIGVAVPTEHAAADPDDPPDRLVALARALGDERRLRILRRLTVGSYTLQELADHFAIPKTTLLHHLVILRAAGIVRVGPGQAGRYTLRSEVPREVQRLLEAYLPVVRPDDGR